MLIVAIVLVVISMGIMIWIGEDEGVPTLVVFFLMLIAGFSFGGWSYKRGTENLQKEYIKRIPNIEQLLLDYEIKEKEKELSELKERQ